MSCFGGLMEEYRNISIDRFDGENLESTAYFLSHCHQDHMNGLTSSSFSHRLGSSNKFHLYCSDITKILLETDDRYVHLQKHLVVLPINQPTTINVPDKTTGKDELIMVTLIPAGHCLGSVMFLFEGNEGTVLYTGDFRLPQGGPARIGPLMSGTSPKHLKSMYIDTTFCVLKARHIPSREESAEAIVNLLEGWIHQSKNHVVKLITKAAYSYEHLFEVIYKKFNKKVHVTDQRYSQYQLIPGLGECTTKDPSETQIHACGWRREKDSDEPLACHYHPPDGELKLMVIQPSTMWFTQCVGMAEIVRELASKFRVCYCFHPSYNEIHEFVHYLQPERVLPNVKPLGHSMKEVRTTLEMFRKSGPRDEIAAGGDNQLTPVKKSLGKLKTLKRKKIQCSPGDSDLIFDEDDFVPRKRKKPSGDEDTKENTEKPMEDDGNSDAESYHTDSYKGSENEDDDILASGDEAKPAPPSGSLLSYMSDDDNSDKDELSNDLSQNSRKSLGFSQSADMFESYDMVAEHDVETVRTVKNGIFEETPTEANDELNILKSNGAEDKELEADLLSDENLDNLLDDDDDDVELEGVNASSDVITFGDCSTVKVAKADSIEQVLDSKDKVEDEIKTNLKDSENISEADVGKKCDSAGSGAAGDCSSKEQKSILQNSLLESSGEHGDIVDTDATTVCSQPISQPLGSDGDVEELDKSASSSTSATKMNKRTARKTFRVTSAMVTQAQIMQARFQQLRELQNPSAGPKVIEVIDLTADDSDGSEDSSIMECGTYSENDYEGDEEEDEEDLYEELDSEDDYAYFRQGQAEILDSDEEDEEDYVEFDEEVDENGAVIIVDSSDDNDDDLDLMGEGRSIVRVDHRQGRQQRSSPHLGEEISSSDVDVIREQLGAEDEDDSDLFDEMNREHVILDDGIVELGDDGIVNLDDSVVDLDSSAVDIDESVLHLETRAISAEKTGQEASKPENELELESNPKVVVLDVNPGPESQDLFSSDPGDHLLQSDPEDADEDRLLGSDLHEADLNADEAKILGSEHEAEAKTNEGSNHEAGVNEDEDKILGSDHAAGVNADEGDILDSDDENDLNEQPIKQASENADVLELENDLLKEDQDAEKLLDMDPEDNSAELVGEDLLLGDALPERSPVHATTKADDDLLGLSEPENPGLELVNEPGDIGGGEAPAVPEVAGESGDLGGNLDPTEGLDADDHLLFSDPEDGRANLNDADLDPNLLD